MLYVYEVNEKFELDLKTYKWTFVTSEFYSSTVNKFEVNCLIKLFYNLVGDVERPGMVIGLDRNAFRNILHTTFGMTDDMIMDRGERHIWFKSAKSSRK
jgi:hypothetical protein